jgi:hypothetical protein
MTWIILIDLSREYRDECFDGSFLELRIQLRTPLESWSISLMLVRYFKPLLIISVLAGVGIWLMAFGWNEVDVNQRLDQSTATIEGRVIDANTRELSKGGQSSTLVVEYAPGNQAAITKTFDVDGATYRKGLASGRAMVSYLPEDPRVSRVTRFAVMPYKILIGLGAVMMFSGAICLWFLMRRRAA